MSIKQLLVVAPVFPIPTDDGHKLRVLNLIKNNESFNKITWILFGSKTEDTYDPKKCKLLGENCERIITIDDKTLKPFILDRNLVKNIFYPHRLTFGVPLYSDTMKDRVNKEILSLKYDFIYFSSFNMFIYADVSSLNKTPYLVDVIDSISLLLWSYYFSEKKFIKKIKTFVDWYWAKRYETIHFPKCKNMVFISDIDAKIVKKTCQNSRIYIVSNGVDANYFSNKCVEEKKPIPGTLLFTGVMNYKPNNDAMIFFIKKIFPLIAARHRFVKLIIAGRDPLPELINIAANNSLIQVTGYVKDIRKEFTKAEVYISPLVSGAGVKNKILEAWAMGLPVVATKTSCAGIEAKNGVNLYVANSATVFAEKVCRLLENKNERKKIGINGKLTVERLYSWKARSHEMQLCIDDILNNRCQTIF